MSEALLRAVHGGAPADNLSLEVLAAMTGQFSEESKLGGGTFGTVFRGHVGAGLCSEWALSGEAKYAELQHLCVAIKLFQRVNATAAAAALHVSATDVNDDVVCWRAMYAAMTREIHVLQRFRHPNIVQLLAYYVPPSWQAHLSSAAVGDNESQRRVCLVYELLDGGNLREALCDETIAQGLTWLTRLRIACGVAKAIYYLHTSNPASPTFHRDVKSANIGLTHEFSAKLIDCGLAKFTDPTGAEAQSHGAPKSLLRSLTGQRFGTPGYMCPTYTRDGKYTAQSEVFSFGMVLLELITGQVQLRNSKDIYGSFIEEKEDIGASADKRAGKWHPDCVQMWADLCRECLDKPKNRPQGMSEVVSRLMDMERKFCVGSVRDRVQPRDRNVMCVVCRDMYAIQEGICCTSNAEPPAPHFYCRDCFSDTVRVQCDGSCRGALIASEGAILCPVCMEPPARPPFADRSIALQLTAEVYDTYSKAKADVLRHIAATETEERLRAEMSTVEGQVQLCCRYIEDHIVILDCPQIIKCPNIQCTASLEVPEDFDSCFALKCDSCRQQFCGWCLVHVGKDAHDHVRRCDKSGNPGNVFVPPGRPARDVLNDVLRGWRRQQVEELLNRLPLTDAAKDVVRDRCQSVYVLI